MTGALDLQSLELFSDDFKTRGDVIGVNVFLKVEKIKHKLFFYFSSTVLMFNYE